MKRHFSIFLVLSVSFFFYSCSSARKARIAKTDKVVYTAQSYIGVPYRYGGTNRSGIDCSGLLFQSFYSVDYQLPRTSREQSKVGKKVAIGELKRGDMVFFSAKPRKNKVTHAGIVTRAKNGSVMFVHASSSRGVIEADLLSDYYRKRFVRGRRIKF